MAEFHAGMHKEKVAADRFSSGRVKYFDSLVWSLSSSPAVEAAQGSPSFSC